MNLCTGMLTTAIVALSVSQCLAQSVVLRDAPKVVFPGRTDCNSPAHWDGDKMYILNSVGHPTLASGRDQFHFGEAVPIKYDNEANGGRWIECTWKADDGALYGWYHLEPQGLCPGNGLTAPKIGALRSADNGANWTDLGIVLEARPGTNDCSYKNGYFIGGNGDFSCMLGHDKKYLYLYFSAYAGDVSEQGVAMARMAWKDRDKPVGKVWKYYNGKWEEPGIGGRLTPIFTAKIHWREENADALWGPSLHWNTYLQRYVMLLNRTAYKPGWPQEGIYISFSKGLSDPKGWSEPVKILDGGSWYPQVLGVDTKAKETDKFCGRQARFYMHGVSEREIIFLKEDDDPSKLPPIRN